MCLVVAASMDSGTISISSRTRSRIFDLGMSYDDKNLDKLTSNVLPNFFKGQTSYRNNFYFRSEEVSFKNWLKFFVGNFCLVTTKKRLLDLVVPLLWLVQQQKKLPLPWLLMSLIPSLSLMSSLPLSSTSSLTTDDVVHAKLVILKAPSFSETGKFDFDSFCMIFFVQYLLEHFLIQFLFSVKFLSLVLIRPKSEQSKFESRFCAFVGKIFRIVERSKIYLTIAKGRCPTAMGLFYRLSKKALLRHFLCYASCFCLAHICNSLPNLT